MSKTHDVVLSKTHDVVAPRHMMTRHHSIVTIDSSTGQLCGLYSCTVRLLRSSSATRIYV
jgi:hypothetical protein